MSTNYPLSGLLIILYGSSRLRNTVLHGVSLHRELALTMSLLRTTELFFKCLPPNVRVVLASTNSAASLEKLAELADKVMEVAAPSTSKIATPPSLAAEVEQLRGEVAWLEKLFRKLAYHHSSSCHASRRSPTPTSDQPNPPADSLCWYHNKFGGQA